MNLEEKIKECYSLSQFCRLIGFHVNGRGIKKAKKLIEEKNLDISHFDGNVRSRTKYKKIKKKCPVCGKGFETKNNSREKKTCSYSCSNSYFRKGSKNGNWKEECYRSTCFEYHKKICVIVERIK
jgi:endogenous inhibitor of DNA gyrase (YacG/DUF329 family)